MIPENFWFLNTLVTVHIPTALGQDGISILEHRVPFCDSPPLHVHHTEDEIFHILDGEFLFQVANEQRRVGPGTFLLAARNTPHTYIVASPGGGRFLTITKGKDFESLVRAVSRPAERNDLPPPSPAPSPEDVAKLARIAQSFGIEFVGTP